MKDYQVKKQICLRLLILNEKYFQFTKLIFVESCSLHGV